MRSGTTPAHAIAFSRSTARPVEAAGPGLVGDRRVREAVCEHDVAGVERGPDDLRHDLRAGGLQQEQLADERPEQAGIEEQVAHPLTQRSVPPGSRVVTTTRPRSSRWRASSRSCVVLPHPSIPSNVISVPAGTAQFYPRPNRLNTVGARRVVWLCRS